MRKEAGLEPWRKLYEVTRLIGSLQPWDYLWDMDVVTLVLPEYEQPFFVSVMGRNGECYAITVMEGPEALRGFYRLAESREIPPGQLIRYQNNLTCYFGDRDELSKAERDRIKALGLKFRGRNQWIFFRAFERGYAPHTMDEEQVLKLTRVFQELFMALRALLEHGIAVDFEKGQTLYRCFDPEQKLWLTSAMPRFMPSPQYLVPVLEDEVMAARLKRQKKVKEKLEIDTLFLDTFIDESKSGRPTIPILLILASRSSGMILDQEFLDPGDDEVAAVLGQVIDYIEDSGRPQKIFVRDEEMAHLLSDLCRRVDIPIAIEGSLQVIDDFAENFELLSF